MLTELPARIPSHPPSNPRPAQVTDNEKYIIPGAQDQPTNSFYKPERPATFIPEYEDRGRYRQARLHQHLRARRGRGRIQQLPGPVCRQARGCPAILRHALRGQSWKGSPGFTGNPGLHVHVDNYATDVGISASVARTLIHYAYAKRKYKGTADAEAIALAKGILDRRWDKFQDKWGISVPERRGDYKRMFTQEVFVRAS